jgi:hypothetical protein
MRREAISCACLLLAAACAGTGEQRTSFPLEAAGIDPAEAVTGDLGWTVALETASMSLGPVYFFEGDPLFARRTIWDRLLGIRVAHAHPGHYQQGEALAQLLEAAQVDLMSPSPARLGTAEGVTGAYRSASVGIHPPAAGPTIELAGTATREGEAVEFGARLDLDLDVEGIAFARDVDGSPGRVRIGIDVNRWLLRADFAELVGEESPVELVEGTQSWNALVRGVDNTSAYVFEWIEEGR